MSYIICFVNECYIMFSELNITSVCDFFFCCWCWIALSIDFRIAEGVARPQGMGRKLLISSLSFLSRQGVMLACLIEHDSIWSFFVGSVDPIYSPDMDSSTCQTLLTFWDLFCACTFRQAHVKVNLSVVICLLTGPKRCNNSERGWGGNGRRPLTPCSRRWASSGWFESDWKWSCWKNGDHSRSHLQPGIVSPGCKSEVPAQEYFWKVGQEFFKSVEKMKEENVCTLSILK